MSEEGSAGPEPGVAVVGEAASSSGDSRRRSPRRGFRSRLGAVGGWLRGPDGAPTVRSTGDSDSSGSEAPPTSARRRWLVRALAVVTVVSVGLAIGFGVAWSNLQSQQNEQAAVKRVAKAFLVAFTNWTPNTVDNDFRTLLTYGTGTFAKQETETFTTATIQGIQKSQASSEGQIRYLYVQSLTGSQAAMYAWVDQTFVSNQVSTPSPDVLQLTMNLVKTGSGWKISFVNVLQAPSSPSSGSSGLPTPSGGS